MMRRGERPRRSRRLLAAREASAACEASTSARAAVLSLLPWTLKRKGSSCLSDFPCGIGTRSRPLPCG